MKYFTPELYLQFNSFDGDEAERADEAWDRAEVAYKERLASIRRYMPSQVVRLSELSLHDALVVARGEQAQPDGPYAFPRPYSWTAVAIVSVTIGAEVVSLIYCLSDHTTTTDAPEGWRFSKLQEQWLYDEVDMIGDGTGPFLHRILLSTGVTLEIPFVSVIIHRVTVPFAAKGAAERMRSIMGHMTVDERLISDRFPRALGYHPEWVLAGVSGAANPLWMTEWLAEALELRPGMRVLDLGCGRALSSIFLRREFGVEVRATDLWFNASENLQRIRDAGVADGVFPIHADARMLPFAAEFFDAVVSIDSFIYYGTDDLYLPYFARFVKPGGPIGIAGAGLIRELDDPVPTHLRDWWAQDQPWCFHTADWWRRHWGRTGILEIEVADALSDGWRYWLDWLRLVAPDNATEIRTLEADAGRHLGYVRVVGRRRAAAPLVEPVMSVPMQYVKKPLLRGPE